MNLLISLPHNAAKSFLSTHQISDLPTATASDPVSRPLGSGAGTIYLLENHKPALPNSEKQIIIHAGGQSRRLPSYAPSGKLSIPIPVLRYSRGQRIDQTLVDLQLPLLKELLNKAPKSLTTLIASGDVLIRTNSPVPNVPEADVVCCAIWATTQLAQHHGVFFMNRNSPEYLDFMLQKPDTQRMAQLAHSHLAMVDIGVWMLSDRALKALSQHSKVSENISPESYTPYDLYSQFGCALGKNPAINDPILNSLSVAILPLDSAEFYHYGTTHEIISSTLALQNRILDQRLIIQRNVNAHPAIFTQNAEINIPLESHNNNVWIENSHIPDSWQISSENVITGVPNNSWKLSLAPGQCVDIHPISEDQYVLRPYGFNDSMRGNILEPSTTFLGMPFIEWAQRHCIDPATIEDPHDIQAAKIFPVFRDITLMGKVLASMLAPSSDSSPLKGLTLLSADEISANANLHRLNDQRQQFQRHAISLIEHNYHKSVFHQLDLAHLADKHIALNIQLQQPLPSNAAPIQRIHDAMFRAKVAQLSNGDPAPHQAEAFSLLRQQFIDLAALTPQTPKLDAYNDQIVWGRSAARIDIAGGWTDTPPHCLLHGGAVVNLAVELNSQQPLQVYVKPSADMAITCRSIDLGSVERITTFEQLQQFHCVGSPFSIPKAALALCGFLPQFCAERYTSLEQQLAHFGCGIELTLLSAIPAGSGLGTSSILAATLLAALSDFCALHWDKADIGNRTLILEQLLTTGGGWQDQYGGILPGVKLLQTQQGFNQTPVVRWLPDTLFRQPDYAPCHLLYYTGITRTAKHILAEIVQAMFLNSSPHLSILSEMKQHALSMFDAIQLGDFQQYGSLIRHSWQLNKALDSGTEPPIIAKLCNTIDDLCLGYKLPGAGGGGYLYIVAKDAQAASRIRTILNNNPITPSARFVNITLSEKALQVSRS